MDRDVGAGILISFAIVGLVAVVFYRPERPPAMTMARPPTAPASHPVPSPTPGVPLARAVETEDAEAARTAPERIVRPASARRKGVFRPVSSFTKVREGETLPDVALRAYGSVEGVGVLWRANRDQLDGPNGPVRAGMILRTP